MNYNELKNYCIGKNKQLQDVAESIGMSRQGLQRAMENQTLPISKVKPLCYALGISISEFFGEQGSKTFNMSGNTVAGEHAYYYESAPIKLLEMQLKEKNEYIKELLAIIKGK